MTNTTKPPLAYSLQEFADAMGISLRKVNYRIAQGLLTPSYEGSKPLISVEEAKRYRDSLPNEKPDAA